MPVEPSSLIAQAKTVVSLGYDSRGRSRKLCSTILTILDGVHVADSVSVSCEKYKGHRGNHRGVLDLCGSEGQVTIWWRKS